jgi:hypothetical protein
MKTLARGRSAHFGALAALAIAGLALSTAPAWAQPAGGPDVSLVPDTLNAPPGAGKVEAQLLLLNKGPAITKVEAVAPLADGQPAAQAKLDGSSCAAGAAGRPTICMVDFTADELPPNYHDTQYLKVTFGSGAQDIVHFVLANIPPDKTALLSVSLPATVALKLGQPIPLEVATGGKIEGLKIEQKTLTEAKTGRGLGGGLLRLCLESGKALDCPPDGTLTLEANTHTRLMIDGADWAGQYQGAISLVSRQTPQGVASNNVTVYVSNNWLKVLGGLLLAFGVFVSWFVTDYLRSLASYYAWWARALKIAATIKHLRAEVRARWTPEQTQAITEKLKEVEEALTQSNLEQNGLAKPGLRGFSSINGDPATSDLQSYLQGLQTWTSVLAILIQEGLEAVGRGQPTGASAEQTAAKIAKIDALAGKVLSDPPSVADTRTSLGAILNPPPPAGAHLIAPFFGPKPAAAPPTVEALEARVTLIDGGAWLAVILITVLTGCYAMLASSASASFGTSVDLWAAFLWGLGLPVGTQIAQGAVTTALSAVRRV